VSNLVQTVLGAVTPELAARLASLFGESTGSVSKGLSAAAPALLAGALQQSSTAGGAEKLLSLVGQAVAGGNPIDRLPALLGDEAARTSLLSQGRGFADGLLGANTGPAADSLASFAGLKAGSASQLLSLAAPLVLGAIGKALGPSPSASGLQSLLADQRASILGALPPGLGSLFGLGGAAQAARTGAATTAAASRGGFAKILPWLIAAAIVLALIFALRSCGKRPEAPVTPLPAEPPAAAAPATPAPVAAASQVLNLPGGGTITVTPGSIGFGVATFLASNEPAPKTFIFDNLNYDTASNALTPESRPTVTTLVSILKAYPNVQTRVVGYTDNQGDPAANKTLSDARAATVKKEMVAQGIADSRIETAGMGEADPIADNATEDGRAKNRRTELVIVKK
jgi:OmpA-OmpF porin, OOP family